MIERESMRFQSAFAKKVSCCAQQGDCGVQVVKEGRLNKGGAHGCLQRNRTNKTVEIERVQHEEKRLRE